MIEKPDCSTCRWADYSGELCCYSGLHPLEKFKSRRAVPAIKAVADCPGYAAREK